MRKQKEVTSRQLPVGSVPVTSRQLPGGVLSLFVEPVTSRQAPVDPAPVSVFHDGIMPLIYFFGWPVILVVHVALVLWPFWLAGLFIYAVIG